MKANGTKLLAVAAIATSCCVSFAQQSNNAGSSGSSSSTQGSYGSSDVTTPATSTSGTGTTTGTSSSRATSTRNFGAESCVGLADRQTERACREGFPVDQPQSYGPTRDRNMDDQAG